MYHKSQNVELVIRCPDRSSYKLYKFRISDFSIDKFGILFVMSDGSDTLEVPYEQIKQLKIGDKTLYNCSV